MRPKKRALFRFFLNSRWIAVVLCVVLFGIGWVLVGEIAYRNELIQEAESLQRSIEEAQRKNRELEELLSVIANPEYLEREAKSKLNLKKEGERVFVVNANRGVEERQQTSSGSILPSTKSWLDFLGLGMTEDLELW